MATFADDTAILAVGDDNVHQLLIEIREQCVYSCVGSISRK